MRTYGDRVQPEWLRWPENHDFTAAANYLNLLAPPGIVDATVAGLRGGILVSQAAKDLMRATGLSLLGENNTHVQKDLQKIRVGKALSPILLVRGDGLIGSPAQIADGYHRVCAAYRLDEDTVIPCVVGDWLVTPRTRQQR